ncbi:MAG TPA: NAD(+)/NADH kinase [Polyangia bacterium]|nr:NAD(+)/NADH kinase [Polyangia bacterium]
MRFGFLLKRDKPEARELAVELIASLRDHDCTAFYCETKGPPLTGATRVDEKDLAASVDALVVLGGDGTFLYGAGLVADRGIPVFGVNLGSLGFITHFQRSEAANALRAACDGTLPIDERMRLRVTVLAPGTGAPIETRSALNDAVISQAAIARLLDLQLELDGEGLTTYKADGLILATPTGSTAYSLAAGGPILTPDLEAIVLTPICPHTLTNRPLVMRADRRLIVKNISERAAQLTVDGQWGRPLEPGQSIEIRKEPVPVRLYRGGGTFFSILHEKLSWGERLA